MLPAADRSALLSLARTAALAASEARAFSPLPPPPGLSGPAGAFVSLHTRSRTLRGCIGYIEARLPLWETVARAARGAAVDDARFPPVSPPELPDLTIEISVLSPPVPASPSDVQVGTHGIILTRDSHRGVLLPQVPTAPGWTREQFLDACCDKAGLPRGAWRTGAHLETFTAEVFHE